MSEATSVRELVDRSDLSELVARHSVWLDEHRYPESDQLFTDDVVVMSPRGQVSGVDELISLARKGHDRYARTLHNKSNLVIEVAGDTATVRAHDLAVFVVDDKTEAIAAAIHQYGARRTADGWRFDRLEITPVALTDGIARAV